MSEKPYHQTQTIPRPHGADRRPAVVALCIAAGAAGIGSVGPIELISTASAEIWRCGDNSYSDRPCADGTQLDVDDARSSAQQDAARRGAKNNAAAARQLERDRRSVEAAQPAPVLIGAPTAASDRKARTKPRSKPPKARPPETERFIARDPRTIFKKPGGDAAESE